MTEKKKEINLIVNKRFQTKITDAKELLGVLSEIFIKRLEYCSMEVMREYLILCKDLLIDMKNVFEIKTDRMVDYLEKILKREMSREQIIALFYDLILKYHGEGNLHGYGYITMEKTERGSRRTTGNFNLNPERQSLTVFHKNRND